jgi:mannose-6-phosphate isomerase-like protein (cupin superfamily)
MSRRTPRRVAVGAVAILSAAGVVAARRAGAPATQPRLQPSAIVAEREARRQDFDWGSLYTYYDAESHGTRDGLAAVAVIKPGWEIHPPHAHAEEEYLMVVEGEGTWHLAGRERPARAGDMQYAAPWDLHGIKNTGRAPLRFVVWKWGSKGVAAPPQPRR